MHGDLAEARGTCRSGILLKCLREQYLLTVSWTSPHSGPNITLGTVTYVYYLFALRDQHDF